MNTPRDILFARHQAAAPKLDAIRRKVVWEGRRVAVPEFMVADTATLPMLIWRELILPSRRIWTGLAAVWTLIFAFNFSQRDPAALLARKTPPLAPEMILTFRQQEKLLAELIGPNEPQAVAPPKSFLPQPRSEGRFETLMT
jgi:hypothetical protein